jgi:hypothetical protein
MVAEVRNRALISWSQTSPSGARFTSKASCGSTKSGGGSRRGIAGYGIRRHSKGRRYQMDEMARGIATAAKMLN